AVGDGDENILQRIAGDDALIEQVVNSLFDGRDELARDGAAEDFVDDLDAAAALVLAVGRIVGERLDAQKHFAELPGAAGLFLVAMMSLSLELNRLAVCDLPRLGVDLEAAVLQLFQDQPQ